MELKKTIACFLAVVSLVTVVNAGDVSFYCFKHCPSGQVLDRVTCRCVVHCPQLRCLAGLFPCQLYQKDVNGCDTCRCLDRCYRSVCPRTCRAGTELYVDEQGCQACRCRYQPVCNYQPRCALHCPHGYVKDANNCDTCHCQPPPCGNGCNIHCPYGRVRDYNGCQLCECNPKPLCGPVCSGVCTHGRVLDRYGCPTCQCLSG